MNVKATLIICAVFAGLSYAHASHECNNAGVVAIFKIENHTNEDMLLDMGDPSHGFIENKRKSVVFSQQTVTAVGCNDSLFHGFETYVRLYGNNYRYMFDWYVEMPLIGDNSVEFRRYAPDHSCDVTYSNKHHGAGKKMQSHQSFGGALLYIEVSCRN
ncbi:hypothetical protein [Endozoicomonas sp. 4G]|uniref:hypothetical protein n=1 Tax=Endozoicomonas sp. 4G TaxID=2872754 RepID=UPI002078F409|nr:hypothetical protein [Endozoicomonas sp. 4G]